MSGKEGDGRSVAEKQFEEWMYVNSQIEREEINASKKEYVDAFEHMGESRLPNLVKEFKNKTKNAIFSVSKDPKEIDDYQYKRGEAKLRVKIVLMWGFRTEKLPIVNTTALFYNTVEIEFRPNGEIKVKGGFGGSTNLCPEKWKNDLELPKKVLEKACGHPRKSCYDPRADNIHLPLRNNLDKFIFR